MKKKADMLLHWADEQFLYEGIPNSPTSLRSDRVIDYALIKGTNLGMQLYIVEMQPVIIIILCFPLFLHNVRNKN